LFSTVGSYEMLSVYGVPISHSKPGVCGGSVQYKGRRYCKRVGVREVSQRCKLLAHMHSPFITTSSSSLLTPRGGAKKRTHARTIFLPHPAMCTKPFSRVPAARALRKPSRRWLNNRARFALAGDSVPFLVDRVDRVRCFACHNVPDRPVGIHGRSVPVHLHQ
jgi:hypothetical protein